MAEGKIAERRLDAMARLAGAYSHVEPRSRRAPAQPITRLSSDTNRARQLKRSELAMSAFFHDDRMQAVPLRKSVAAVPWKTSIRENPKILAALFGEEEVRATRAALQARAPTSFAVKVPERQSIRPSAAEVADQEIYDAAKSETPADMQKMISDRAGNDAHAHARLQNIYAGTQRGIPQRLLPLHDFEETKRESFDGEMLTISGKIHERELIILVDRKPNVLPGENKYFFSTTAGLIPVPPKLLEATKAIVESGDTRAYDAAFFNPVK